MTNLQQYLQDFREGSGFRRRFARWLLKDAVAGLDAAVLDLRTQQEALNAQKASLDAQKATLAVLEQEIHGVQNILPAMQTQQDGTAELAQALHGDLDALGTNVRNNNARLDALQSDNALCKVKIAGVERRAASTGETTVSRTASAPVKETAAEDADYAEIDYFDFENHFRGSIENIRLAQRQYLPYFHGKQNVLDIGCGRGEFLSLLQEEGIPAKGVDLYAPYADFCRMQGLDVKCGDGIAFLEHTEVPLDGIFAGQVVEHLKTAQIIRLCEIAYEKLEAGGCILIETPNPTSLAIYTNAFYIDPSHVKPVHPLTMQYFLEKAGFTDITILYPESSRPPFRIPPLRLAEEEHGEAFGEVMQHVSDLLFGSQDYAIIAVKAAGNACQ